MRESVAAGPTTFSSATVAEKSTRVDRWALGGLVGGDRDIETRYGRTVSFGIRRCEFDHYLLRRSRARLRLGTSISSIRRERGRWIVNDSIAAPLLVGAGGHFCPVARRLNPTKERRSLVVAQEAEFPIPRRDDRWRADAGTPELYYCQDLKGYGWSFRKGDFLNVGLGRLDARSLPDACSRFVAFLQERGRVPRDASWRWHGHAYLVCDAPYRRIVDDGVMLIGDAAGLAYAESGEGILDRWFLHARDAALQPAKMRPSFVTLSRSS